MDDEAIRRELEAMGIGADLYHMVLLLPLVQVAWADGKVQQGERTLILDVARKSGIADGEGQKVLEKWLSERPSEYYMSRGRKLLAALAAKAEFEAVTLSSLEDVVAYCHGVAEAAGGLFGFIGGKVSSTEDKAIADIAGALHVEGSKNWRELLG